jgi:hypothetical protein
LGKGTLYRRSRIGGTSKSSPVRAYDSWGCKQNFRKAGTGGKNIRGKKVKHDFQLRKRRVFLALGSPHFFSFFFFFFSRNLYSNVTTDDGNVLATPLIVRGAMTTQDVDCEVDKLQTKNAHDFVEWIPNNVKVTFPSSTCYLWAGSLLVKFFFGVPPVPLTFWTRRKEKFH